MIILLCKLFIIIYCFFVYILLFDTINLYIKVTLCMFVFLRFWDEHGFRLNNPDSVDPSPENRPAPKPSKLCKIR